MRKGKIRLDYDEGYCEAVLRHYLKARVIKRTDYESPDIYLVESDLFDDIEDGKPTPFYHIQLSPEFKLTRYG